MNRRKVGVYGCGTVQGLELLRVLAMHPMIEPVFASDDALSGHLLAEEYPGLSINLRLPVAACDAALARDADLVFCALDLRDAATLVPQLRRAAPGTKIVDLSPLMRPGDEGLFHRLYRLRHPAPELLSSFVYGVSEGDKAAIAGAQCVAVPGSVAAGIVAALAPLAARDLVHGRVLVQALLGSSAAESMPSGAADSASAGLIEHDMYSDTGLAPAISMELGAWFGRGAASPFDVLVHPVRVPAPRGVFVSAWVNVGERLTLASIDGLYREHYARSLFVRLLHTRPRLRDVLESPRVHISALVESGTLLATAALDDLGYGGAMRAVACANLMLGLPEEAGVMFPGRSW